MAALFSFGEWLKQRRSALLLSRADLAQQVGCAEVTLRKIEADERRPSLQVAERLVDLLELRADERTLFLQVARGLASADRLPPPIPRGAAVPALPLSTPALLALPSGTVTFLFTDIAGSTQLWEQQPDAMRSVLACHDALLRAGITAHGGAVVKSTGDGMHAVFARATDAVHAALAAQRSLAAEEWGPIGLIGVRMALHTGVTQERDGDYFGPPLNRVARLLAAGHGGQILLSLATATLVQDQLPSGVRVRDLGERHLKDLARPEHVFQLLVPDLPAEFPPLRALETWPNNLPAPLTSFVGRAQECAAVAELLASQRLVTLTGPGGTGKTRLALHIAADRLEQFSHGVWLVELAPLADPLLVPLAVASVLGLREEAGRPLLTVLTDYLRSRTLLLLLDNCEHLVDACAQLVETLLRACPQLRILASSREALGVAGEAPFRVPPLRTPDPRQLPELEAFGQYEAVRLFTERATSVLSSFRVTSANMAALAQVCSRLDGIPLALELAAARVNVLRVEQIAARLDDRFRLLTGASRSAVPRQQTLRALIDWSHDLLSAPEQQMLRHLAVCAGGWTLEAAEAVCVGEGLEQERVLDVLSRLVDKSLVQAERVLGQEARYRMLETIRQYALECLAASGAADTIRRRHADHYLALAETAAPHLEGRERGTWLDRLDLEHDNLRAALGWALEGGDAEVGVRLVVALSRFWDYGYWSEARVWSQRAMAGSSVMSPALRARVFRIGAWWGGEQAMAMYEEALTLFRATGDTPDIALTLREQGELTRNERDYPRATRLLEESLALYRELGDQSGSAAALHALGDCARERGDLARAAALLEESVASFRALGMYEPGQAGALTGLGDVALCQGDDTRAAALYWEALTLSRSAGDLWYSTWPLHNLGWLALVQGDDGRVRVLLEEHVAWCRGKQSLGLTFVLHLLGALVSVQGDATRGTAQLREALALQQQIGFQDLIVENLDGLAWMTSGQGQPARAARLLGATESMLVGGTAAWRFAHEHFVAATRAQLDDAAFAAAWAEGQALTLEQAIAEALNR